MKNAWYEMTSTASTGLEGLDQALNYLRKGDNVVWQVDSIEDYAQFVGPYVEQAKRDNRRVVYMRFADHKPLIDAETGIPTYALDAHSGFETFSTQIHNIIAKEGLGVYYVFDSLSYLLDAWATDLMIGNFFMITCPFLFELDTLAYFALLRSHHSFKTVARIRETTQLLLDLYNSKGTLYVHPLKVWKRYTPTMFLPHRQQDDKFVPVTSSADTTRLFAHISQAGLEPSQRALDYWDRLFLGAQELSEQEDAPEQEKQETLERLCQIIIGREERILKLAKEHLTLRDLLAIKSKMIGTGFIGGKAVGMLLANKILSQNKGRQWSQNLEPHDSFYVGSDVFYTYLVENGWWMLRMEQKTQEGYFKAAVELREKMLTGRFPDQVREQFMEMIEYFGQSPIIVRSSSLLEDGFGNAFAGKYESFFCVNQGSPAERYEQFREAVREVYASTMNEDALTYRRQRNLDQHDEQMALLIQRVSGSHRKSYFFPDLAGVGMSHNTFVWNSQLDPSAGMIRLVVGLGTRAVNRVEDDYPRIVALDAPTLTPLAGMEDMRRFSQNQVDLLDIQKNKLTTVPLQDLIQEKIDLHLDLVASPDLETTKRARDLGNDQEYWLLTFKKLFEETSFTQDIREILNYLEEKYEYPVDVEFTMNFDYEGNPMINVVQCRPLQTKGQQARVQIPANPNPADVLFKCSGYFMGGSISTQVHRIIYVREDGYVPLGLSQKYDVARVVGLLNKQINDREKQPTILLGPGRWGTTTPSLGVPVRFSEINNIMILCEVAYEGGNLMPELSFGTHFFQDLVENDIFYLALFPQQDRCTFNRQWFDSMPNQLAKILPDKAKYQDVISVFDIEGDQLHMFSDVLTQKLLCCFERNG
ncbi:PEP/pyruvate-binding domain-containing protein [Planctomycetota bacterium]